MRNVIVPNVDDDVDVDVVVDAAPVAVAGVVRADEALDGGRPRTAAPEPELALAILVAVVAVELDASEAPDENRAMTVSTSSKANCRSSCWSKRSASRVDGSRISNVPYRTKQYSLAGEIASLACSARFFLTSARRSLTDASGIAHLTTVYCEAQCTLNVVPAAFVLTVREIKPAEAEEVNDDEDESEEDSEDDRDDGKDEEELGGDVDSSTTAGDLAGSDGGVFFVGDGIGSDFFALTALSFKSTTAGAVGAAVGAV